MTRGLLYDIVISCLKTSILEKTALNGSGTTSMGIFLLGFFRLYARRCLREIFLPTRLSRSFLLLEHPVFPYYDIDPVFYDPDFSRSIYLDDAVDDQLLLRIRNLEAGCVKISIISLLSLDDYIQ